MIPRVLVIAGSDSGGGAGIQADIKTVMALGGYAITAITAITAQNTLGVTMVETLSPAIVIAQIDAVLDDIGADAVKIGMIGSSEIATAVADHLTALKLDVPIVFDPVMVATSGATLADALTIAAFDRLMALATLVTPNLPELAALAGRTIEADHEIVDAATALSKRTGSAVLVKGGHSGSLTLTDRLIDASGIRREWTANRIATRSTHGTGCTLASAIAIQLGFGEALEAAIGQARTYVRHGLSTAPALGRGHGPLGHSAVGLNLSQ